MVDDPFGMDFRSGAVGLQEDPRKSREYPETNELPDANYVAYTDWLVKERRAGMSDKYTEWRRNMLMKQGDHWLEYDALSANWVLRRSMKRSQREKEDSKEYPVVNRISLYARITMSQLTRNRPATECIPESTEPKHLAAAAFGDHIAEAKWQELMQAQTLRQVVAWMIPTGNGFLWPQWDPRGGEMKELKFKMPAIEYDDRTGLPVQLKEIEVPFGPDAQPIMTQNERGELIFDLQARPHRVEEGEIADRVISPFMVLPDSDIINDKDMRSVVIVEVISLMEAEARYPHLKGKLTPEEVSEWDIHGTHDGDPGLGYSRSPDGRSQKNFYTGSLPGTAIGRHATKNPTGEGKVVLKHYLERPSSEFPWGRQWSIIRDMVADEPGELKDDLWPPLLHLKQNEVEGDFWGRPTMTDGLGPQVEYNKMTARIALHQQLQLNPRILAPKYAKVQRDGWQSNAGAVITYAAAQPGEVRPLDTSPIPPDLFAERDRTLRDQQDLLSMHPLSMGAQPSPALSGRAVLAAQEANDMPNIPAHQSLEEFVARWAWYILRIIKERYDEPRMIRWSGKDKAFQARAFAGTDLKHIVGVRPVLGSSAPWSVFAMQEIAMELMRQSPGLFTDPETGRIDRNMIRTALTTGGQNIIGVADDPDVARALRENEMIQVWGGVIEEDLPWPEPWDVHAVHMRQHAMLLQSSELEDWPQINREALASHWIAHYELYQADRMNEAMMGSPDVGSPPMDGKSPSTGRSPSTGPDAPISLTSAERTGTAPGP